VNGAHAQGRQSSRRAACWLALVAAASLTLGCETIEGWTSRTSGPAQVSVEVWSGFTQRPEGRRPPPERVELVLDVTASMQATAADSPARFVAAQQSARRLLRALPSDTQVGLRALGSRSEDTVCSRSLVLSNRDGPRTPAQVAALVPRLRPHSEASIAAALDGLREDLGDAVGRTRVVLFTDLGAECGGDLCASAAALVDAGARLDVVLFSDAVVPQCFASFTPGGEPQAQSLAFPPAAATFRVEAHRAGADAAAPAVLARGRADGTPVEVASGGAIILLETEPPATIGPLVLSPGTSTRVRVLDFPTLDPPVREWRWDVVPLGSDD
jgi:hypothetical protein